MRCYRLNQSFDYSSKLLRQLDKIVQYKATLHDKPTRAYANSANPSNNMAGSLITGQAYVIIEWDFMIPRPALMLTGQALMIVGQARVIIGETPNIIRQGPTTNGL